MGSTSTNDHLTVLRHYSVCLYLMQNAAFSSGGFKLEGLVGHWPRGPPLLYWFHRPTSETRGRLRGGDVKRT